MKLAAVATPNSVKMRNAIRKVGKNIIVVHNKRGGKAPFMSKATVDAASHAAKIIAFTHRLSDAQVEGASEDEQKRMVAVTAYHETGRKFDKVYVTKYLKGGGEEKDVRYFVSRADGTIYGAKSPLAPNLKWYFGTLDTIDLWDWSGHHGVPKDAEKAGVKEVGAYGEYKHYEPVKKKQKVG